MHWHDVVIHCFAMILLFRGLILLCVGMILLFSGLILLCIGMVLLCIAMILLFIGMIRFYVALQCCRCTLLLRLCLCTDKIVKLDRDTVGRGWHPPPRYQDELLSNWWMKTLKTVVPNWAWTNLTCSSFHRNSSRAWRNGSRSNCTRHVVSACF
jgi:hypothetical protein